MRLRVTEYPAGEHKPGDLLLIAWPRDGEALPVKVVEVGAGELVVDLPTANLYRPGDQVPTLGAARRSL